jgi:hypothetical protein
MRTLVIGDVHGCADELAALAEEVGPDRIVQVGDLFTKGPDPLGVWRFVRDHHVEAVRGNHDDRLVAYVDGRRPHDHGAAKTVDALRSETPAWLAWVRALPLWIEDVAGFTVVHAMIHPSGSLDATTRPMALTWRRWPDDAPDAPAWHQVYEGDRRVIFGHDARRGLVRVERSGRPLLIGLDTGCVYGGQLSGYVVEEDRIVQVPARPRPAPP